MNKLKKMFCCIMEWNWKDSKIVKGIIAIGYAIELLIFILIIIYLIYSFIFPWICEMLVATHKGYMDILGIHIYTHKEYMNILGIHI